MTIRLNELRKQEREDLVCVVECLHALAATRESLIEAEQERFMLFNEEAVKHENALEQVHAKLEDACRGLALGIQGSTLDLLDKLVECARSRDAEIERLRDGLRIEEDETERLQNLVANLSAQPSAPADKGPLTEDEATRYARNEPPAQEVAP